MDGTSNIDRRIRSIEAILSNARVVSSLAELSQISRTFQARVFSTPRDREKGDLVTLLISSIRSWVSANTGPWRLEGKTFR